MLISTLAITGGTVAVGTGVLYKSHQPSKTTYWTDYHKKVTKKKEKEKGKVKEKVKKKGFSLYEKIVDFNNLFKTDRIVPVSRQPKSLLFQIEHSPWQETNKIEVVEQEKNLNQEKYRIKEDVRLFVRYISKYWRPYRGVALLSGASLMAFGLYETSFAYALKVIVDGASGGNTLITVMPILQKLLIAFPAVAVTTIVGQRIAARLGSRIVSDMHYDIFEHLQQLSVGFYKEAKLGDILARFSSDMFYVRIGMGMHFLPAVVDILTLCVSTAFMFWVSWQMALISLLSLPLMAYVLGEFSPRLSEANFALKKQEALMIHAVQEGVRAQPMVKSFSTDQFMQDCFLRELNKVEDRTTEAIFSRAMFESTSIISLFLAQLTSISAGLLLLTGGYISSGGLISYMVMQTAAHQHIHQLFRFRFHLLMMAGVGLRRVEMFLQNPVEVVDAPDAIELPAFRRAIRFENVSFGYSEESKQLEQIDFLIKKGQFVAFVGPSGAGKSTILNLLLRFYEVGEGRVTIDGVDIRTATQASLREQMGIVLQDTFIFNASILDNIRVVKPDASKKEVIQAAQAAELHDFIMTLPEGYETNAGEAGGRLSGGQKQRIAIARAMLRHPAILVLDEATSALDAETAAAIEATIHDLAKERTVISISHHLRTVTKADQIFVLDQGHLIEQGTHEELLAERGLYASLWDTQRSLTVPSES